MKIAKYIGDLIYDYECVVVPGLGGFISNEKSAAINKVTNQFKPPYKEIHFNVHLKANDGLLVNYVAKNEGVSYKQAKANVDKFVLLCHKALDKGKRINFSKIGYIFRDVNGYISFKQDAEINYNAESFGLTNFVSPAIRRPDSSEKIREKIESVTSSVSGGTKTSKVSAKSRKEDRRKPSEISSVSKMPARKKPSKIRQQLLFVLVILVAMGSYYVAGRRDAMSYYWNRHKSKVPLMYNNPGDYISANAGYLPYGLLYPFYQFIERYDGDNQSGVEQNKINSDIKLGENTVKPGESEIVNYDGDIAELPDDIDDVENSGLTKEPEKYIHNNSDIEQPVEETVVVNEPVEEKPVVKYQPQASTQSYYIIAGSFGNEANAIRLVNNLKIKGFNAQIADTNGRGMFRVAYMGFNNMAEAERQLAIIRKETNAQAWILEK